MVSGKHSSSATRMASESTWCFCLIRISVVHSLLSGQHHLSEQKSIILLLENNPGTSWSIWSESKLFIFIFRSYVICLFSIFPSFLECIWLIPRSGPFHIPKPWLVGFSYTTISDLVDFSQRSPTLLNLLWAPLSFTYAFPLGMWWILIFCACLVVFWACPLLPERQESDFSCLPLQVLSLGVTWGTKGAQVCSECPEI